MFAHLRTRSEAALDDICYELERRSFVSSLCAALDSSTEARALTISDLQAYQPTTSLARLQAGEPFYNVMDRPFTPVDADAGNVKVVVRVRKFIKRGRPTPSDARAH